MAKIIIYLIASNTPRFPYTHFTQKSLISIVINTRLLINNLRHRFPLSPSLSLNLKNSSISTLVNFHDAYKKKKKKETLYNKYTSLRSKKTKKKIPRSLLRTSITYIDTMSCKRKKTCTVAIASMLDEATHEKTGIYSYTSNTTMQQHQQHRVQERVYVHTRRKLCLVILGL